MPRLESLGPLSEDEVCGDGGSAGLRRESNGPVLVVAVVVEVGVVVDDDGSAKKSEGVGWMVEPQLLVA